MTRVVTNSYAVKIERREALSELLRKMETWEDADSSVGGSRRWFSFGFARIAVYPLCDENLYHDSVMVIVPRFTSFDEDFCALLLSSHQAFLLAEQISFDFWRSEKKYDAPVFVSPLLKRHLPNPSSFFQRNVRARASPGPLDYLSRAVTSQECLAMYLPCPSCPKKNCSWVTVSVACLSGSISIGFPHAGLSLRVVTEYDNVPNFLERLD